MAAYNGLYMAWVGAGDDPGIYWSMLGADGVTWSKQARVPGISSSCGPALTQRPGLPTAPEDDIPLLVFKHEGDDGVSVCQRYLGKWEPARPFLQGEPPSGIGTSATPAITTATQGPLGYSSIMAWKGSGADKRVWWSFSDSDAPGRKWSAAKVVPFTWTDHAPACSYL